MNDIHQLHEDFKDHIKNEQFQREIDLKEERDNFDKINVTLSELKKCLDNTNRKLEPIIDAYRAILVSKSFILGLGAVVAAIGVIGAGVVYFIRSIK